MADPFEVRMRFISLLSHLSASTTSSLKTAAYALKHRDMDEDLHSCIIENLERSSNTSAPAATAASADNKPPRTDSSAAALMNNRANVMYFLEHFCEMAIREKHEAYVEFVKRDLGKIVDSVAASGANVKVVRRVVGTLGEKGVLSEQEVLKVEENLKGKEKERGQFLGEEDDAVVGVEDVEMGDVNTAEGDTGSNRKSVTDAGRSVPRSGRDGKSNGVSKADKRAIEQRIEEDRERNKRLREGVWAVSGDDEQELEKMWEEGSELSEDDYVIGQEEADERRQFARYHQNLLQR